MAFKGIHALVAVVGLAAAGASGWWVLNNPATPTADARSTGAGAPKTATTGAGAPPTARAAGVEVSNVALARLQDDAQAVGTLRSRQSTVLRPEVAGRITQLGFADGARVKKGQLLVQLDGALQAAELQQAMAQVAIARANFKRNQELVAQQFVAQRVLDESQAALQVAEAQLALAEARLRRMSIVAPFDGTVGIRSVNVGDFVKDGADLVNLEDLSSLYVDFRLPERFVLRLQRGQVVDVQLEALPGRTLRATVDAIDPLVDANGRSMGVRAVLPNTAGLPVPGGDAAPLRPGMFAKVTTVFAVRERALTVPEEAIVPQAGKQFVIKVVSADTLAPEARAKLPPDTALVSQRVEVKLGIRRPGRVELLAGVAEGDTVVVAGQQRLQRDGTAVRVVDMARPAGPPAAPAPR